MNRTHVALVVLAVVGLLAAGGAAVYTGVGPAPGGGSGDDIEDFPTETASSSGGDDTSTGGAASSGGDATEAPFAFTIDEVDECGTTCRDVTVTLENQQDQPASGVTVFTRIYVGRDNTAGDDLIWEGKEPVGTIDAGRETTHTERVELSFSEAMAVQRNDGWITVVTTVQTDDRTVTFTDAQQVG